MMYENLCDSMGCFLSWAISTGISDHKAIVFQLDFYKRFVHDVFKFNHCWFKDPALYNMIGEKWHSYSHSVQIPSMLIIVKKLSLLKNDVIKWEKEKKAKNAKDLVQIEMELEELTGLVDGAFFPAHRKERLILLETQKARILRQEEET